MLDGSDGNDQLFGGDGIDTMRGQRATTSSTAARATTSWMAAPATTASSVAAATIRCSADTSADQLTGGDGRDSFLWTSAAEGRDTIADFELGADRFAARRSAAGTSTAAKRRWRGMSASSPCDRRAACCRWTATEAVPAPGAISRWSRAATACRRATCSCSGGLVIDDVVPPTPRPFEPLAYIASYDDLIQAFGANAAAGEQHYLSNGQAEGRSVTFDGLQYIASYRDLIDAFGANAAAGTTHFITNGFAEGRDPDNFNEVRYLANYADLQAAFGNDLEAATQHFITNGFAEGRTDFVL